MAAPTRFSELLYRYIDRAESLMLVLIIAGVVCNFLHLSYAEQILVIAFSGLAVVFFLNAYRPPAPPSENQPERKDSLVLLTQTILPKILWISAAVGAAALSMVHQQAAEAGYKQMFFIGGIAAVGCLALVGLAAVLGRNIQHLIPVLYRAIPIALVGAHYLGYY